MRYFTGDHHFGHRNIIEYTQRPFAGAEEMNAEMKRIWNEVVNPEDTVYQVGDFAFLGVNRKELEKELNGTIVHFQGNHDPKRWGLISGTLKFGGHTIFISHRPPRLGKDDPTPPPGSIMLCGHVHEKWKVRRLIQDPTVIIVNVGVDVWDFRPITIKTVNKAVAKFKREGPAYVPDDL